MKKNFKTCILFSYDMFSKINIPDELKGIVQKNIKEYAQGAEKVIFELSDSKDIRFHIYKK